MIYILLWPPSIIPTSVVTVVVKHSSVRLCARLKTSWTFHTFSSSSEWGPFSKELATRREEEQPILLSRSTLRLTKLGSDDEEPTIPSGALYDVSDNHRQRLRERARLCLKSV